MVVIIRDTPPATAAMSQGRLGTVLKLGETVWGEGSGDQETGEQLLQAAVAGTADDLGSGPFPKGPEWYYREAVGI